MFYAIFVPQNCDTSILDAWPRPEDLIFEDIKEANATLKRYKGSRMKTFNTREKALNFLNDPDKDESFLELDTSHRDHDLATSLEKLTLQQSPRAPSSLLWLPSPTSSPALENDQSNKQPISASADQKKSTVQADEAEPTFPSVKPGLLNQLRRKIEAGDYEAVEETIWSNPRYLITVCDTAIYLMAGPKYNACHIAARANKPDIMALILDTITNFSFLRKLYPNESDINLQDRVNHLLDSYLNTPDPRQGNTPLHFACKLGHYRVVRVLLTFEGCELNLKDSNGRTAEESICSQSDQAEEVIKRKIKSMFKQQLHLPLFRDQLKKRLTLEKARGRAGSQAGSDTSFSDLDGSFSFNSPAKQDKAPL